MNLGERSSLLLLVAFLFVSAFVLNASANAEEAIRSLCDRSELVKEKVLEYLYTSNCKGIHLNHGKVSRLDFSFYGGEERRSFSSGDFANMPSLENLVFVFEITSSPWGAQFPEDTFKGLSSVAWVIVVLRGRTQIPKGLLKNFSHLKKFAIYADSLATITREDLSGLVDVEQIIFDGNYLELIEDNAFASLNKLKSVTFQGTSSLSKTRRAAFTGVLNPIGLPSRFGLNENSMEAGTWD